MTNRALVLAGVAESPTVITGALVARDTLLASAALTALGAEVDIRTDAFHVDPRTMVGDVDIDCGLAGTVMRFFPPIAALASGDVRFDGDPRARERPLAALTGALRQLGVEVAGDALPLTVVGGGGVRGGAATLDSSASSQFVSGLLLAAARYDEGLVLRHHGPAMPSLPHVDMTVAMLRERGVDVECDCSDLTDARWRVAPGAVAGGTFRIEPDLSNAGPFLAAAMVTGGEVEIVGWPHATTQAGDALRTIFTDMGGTCRFTPTGLSLSGPDTPSGIDADLGAVGELVPTVAAVAACASGTTVLRGIAHLRGHETDRISALVRELRRLGCVAYETPDGLTIEPARMTAATVHCYADHRMSTFGAILGLVVPGVTLDDIGATSKTLPEFAHLWHNLVVGSST